MNAQTARLFRRYTTLRKLAPRLHREAKRLYTRLPAKAKRKALVAMKGEIHALEDSKAATGDAGSVVGE